MPDPVQNEKEFDASAIASGIASEITGASAPEPSDTPEDNGITAPAAPDPQAGLTAAQARALPKAWKKEMESYWTQLPPQVHDYVYEREANVQRGIQQYQQGYSSWQKLLEPYQQIFQSNPNIDPVTVLQTVMNQHMQLARGTPEQKRALMKQLMQAYKVEFDEAPGGQSANPQFEELAQRLNRIEGAWNSVQQAAQREAYAKNLQTVEQFSADPKNEYWNEVVDDIHVLLRTGAVSTLPDAYEMACNRNPKVREKIVAKLVDEQLRAKMNTPAGRFPNVNGAANTPSRGRKMTIEETIDSIAAKHITPH